MFISALKLAKPLKFPPDAGAMARRASPRNSRPHEDIQFAATCEERFGFTTQLLDTKKEVGKVAALHLEARIILTVEDGSLTGVVKKKKLEHLVAKVGDMTKTYNLQMKAWVHKRLLTHSMSALISGSTG